MESQTFLSFVIGDMKTLPQKTSSHIINSFLISLSSTHIPSMVNTEFENKHDDVDDDIDDDIDEVNT